MTTTQDARHPEKAEHRQETRTKACLISSEALRHESAAGLRLLRALQCCVLNAPLHDSCERALSMVSGAVIELRLQCKQDPREVQRK